MMGLGVVLQVVPVRREWGWGVVGCVILLLQLLPVLQPRLHPWLHSTEQWVRVADLLGAVGPNVKVFAVVPGSSVPLDELLVLVIVVGVQGVQLIGEPVVVAGKGPVG